MLCRTLVCAYDQCVLQTAGCGNTSRLYVIMTLKMVLAVCDSAKDTALESKQQLIQFNHTNQKLEQNDGKYSLVIFTIMQSNYMIFVFI